MRLDHRKLGAGAGVFTATVLTLLSLSVGVARSEDQFDPDYLRIFSARPSAIHNRQKYWIFTPAELGKFMGCYRWGCNAGGRPLLGRRVVTIGKFAESPFGGSDLTKGLTQIEADSTMGLMTSVFSGSPPPFSQVSPQVVASMRRQEAAYRCGKASYCIAVFWGDIRYSTAPLNAPFMARGPYYYLHVEGVKVFDRYTIASAAKEGARFGLGKGLSMIASSGFQMLAPP